MEGLFPAALAEKNHWQLFNITAVWAGLTAETNEMQAKKHLLKILKLSSNDPWETLTKCQYIPGNLDNEVHMKSRTHAQNRPEKALISYLSSETWVSGQAESEGYFRTVTTGMLKVCQNAQIEPSGKAGRSNTSNSYLMNNKKILPLEKWIWFENCYII